MPDSSTAGSRTARLTDAKHLIHLAIQFPDLLPEPTTGPSLVAFRFADLDDAAEAAQAVREAERLLSDHLGVTFERNEPDPIGSAAYYQRQAELPSGVWVYLTTWASVAPLLDADAPRELEAVAA